ncbi:MAG: phosphatidylcholine/phosphatidylserine synthase, partial [Alphaproteobacteria bacterium]
MSRPPRRAPVALVQLVPNMVTLAGMSLGLTAIRFATEGYFASAAFLILVAAVLDGLDGLLARRLKATSDIGAQLDSLSDFVTFGAAPALIVYLQHLSGLAGLGWLATLLFVGACGLRLARFNVQSGKVNDATPPDRAHFVGVPAPAGALLGLLPSFLAASGALAPAGWPVTVSLWLVLVAMLMVSTLR